MNAYIVFKQEESVKKAIEELNAQVFLDHHIRVDSAASEGNVSILLLSLCFLFKKTSNFNVARQEKVCIRWKPFF